VSAVGDLHCRDDERRRLTREKGINGVDYVDVSEDQLSLTVYFLLKAPPEVRVANVRIDGGRRIRDIQVTDVQMCRVEDPDLDDCMHVSVDRFGDFSTYRLCLVDPDEDGGPGTSPMTGIDPRHACVDFSFKVDCPSAADCGVEDSCPPEVYSEPELSYLAKDYASFRQLILDRLALVMPDWQERHVPDLGIALVELLAYVGDYLSYHQDAVATEAYLDTARLRTSVRRHARLVDYLMHEGCNARAWVCVETDTDVVLPADVSFITGPIEIGQEGRVLTWNDLETRPFGPYEVFEPVLRAEIAIWQAHNAMYFHTWGDRECCIARGATSATLLEPTPPAEPAPKRGRRRSRKDTYEQEAEPPPTARSLHLRAGDVLIFEEVLGAKTGDPADADPQRRHAVMLTRVEEDVDPVTGDSILQIEWGADDALPFALCISAIGLPPECRDLANISIARGNVILSDHGRRVHDETLGSVPVTAALVPCEDAACGEQVTYVAGRFRPQLDEQPVTFATAPPVRRSAHAVMRPPDPRAARAQIELSNIPLAPGGSVTLFDAGDVHAPEGLVGRLRDETDAVAQALRERLSEQTIALLEQEDDDGLSTALRAALVDDLRRLREPWSTQPDLLSSDSEDRHHVVEVDNEGFAHLRFGDGDLGILPPANATFMADYRIGNGPAGNVGAETITRIVFDRTVIHNVDLRPRNPFPAWGGTVAEPIRDVKLRAPTAFRRELVRAITADDYARLAERHPGVQRAAATMRWTGSWPVVRVAIDPFGETATTELLGEVRQLLEPVRRIGYDVAVVGATNVPLLISLIVCVQPFALRAHVEVDVRRALGSRPLPGGELGFFHPDALTFGDDIFVSALVARVQALPGVESVSVEQLQRLHGLAEREIDEGVLRLGPLEVAQLASDPNFPENGRLELLLEGGR
jgi:hypothetical protein